MPITVIQPASSKQLTTLAQVINDLDIPVADVAAKSYFLSKLIVQASNFIRNYTGREFAVETVEETFVGNGRVIYTVSRTPIISVEYVKLSGTTIDPSLYLIQDPDAGFLYKETGWNPTFFVDGFIEPRWSQYGRFNWAVKYTAGYVLPDDEEDRTLPDEIERVCLDLIKSYYYDQKRNPSIVREKIGESAVWFTGSTGTPTTNSYNLPDSIIATLDRWKEV